ncbi:MAG: DUF1552 domain-containing protein [Verrucomicrobia bacterium]|nr:DUF1552 domain-containing protein [Verrucomicrobiota bacterium]MDB4746053.1 DUF1552 domain-containing protein [Verrucomicrobiota bacterium]
MNSTSNLNSLDRRRFLCGAGWALALPLFESFSVANALASGGEANPRRLGCFYFPDGVPMPLPNDPAYEDWAWFPHGNAEDFTFTKCMEPLEPLRNELTVLSGLSHSAGRNVHGHNNADQFLTAAATGSGDMDYQNTISLDQVYARQVGDQTRFASLVMSTDGGMGTARGAHTISFNRQGRAIPAENRPKRIFDMLFVKSDALAARQLAHSESALDELLADARRMRRRLSSHDQGSLDEYLQSVREAEIRVQKAKQWNSTPLPSVNGDHLNLEITPDEPRSYLRTMFELIYLAFKTDSTRVATYQIGRENGVGISDHLSRAIGFPAAHQLSHETKSPDGWKNFGTYCRFLHEEYGRFVTRLKQTPEPAGEGTLLDNTLLLFGSASSAFHLSRNYPLILAGGRNMGVAQGQYLNHAGGKAFRGGWKPGDPEPWTKKATNEDLPLSNLYVSMLQRLGVETETFADSTGKLDGV